MSYCYQKPDSPTVSESKVAQSVAAELTNPAGSGGRHTQMKSLILSLLEIGLSAQAVFVQFRDGDVQDSEIEAIIEWGLKRIEKGPGVPAPAKRPALTREEAIDKATAWLDGFEIDEGDLWSASMVRPDDDPSQDTILLLKYRYQWQRVMKAMTQQRGDSN